MNKDDILKDFDTLAESKRKGAVNLKLCLGFALVVVVLVLAWGLVGVLAAVLAKAPFFRRAWAVCAYGFLAGFLYGAVTDLWTIMAMGESLSWPLVFTAYAAAVPFNVLHGMGNIVFLMLLYRPLGGKLKRMQEKFGVLASGKNT